MPLSVSVSQITAHVFELPEKHTKK